MSGAGQDRAPLEGGESLTVRRSFSGLAWKPRLADERKALLLAQSLAMDEPVARALAGRGIGPDEAESFLNPTLRACLPDPSHLLDMDKAAERIADAVTRGETLAVFGDYDVDGATSSALLLRFFRALGAPCLIHIPDRMTEGYGPNTPALLRLKAGGARVVITVDCGITAFAPLAEAADKGLEVIVVDHHVAEPDLPRAFAVINPNRLDQTSDHGQLAAVGVAFLLVVAINRVLRRRGDFTPERPEPDLRQWLDIVALGTVCDQVRLTGVNRALVVQGLKVMGQRLNTGISALADTVGLESRPEAWHLGFLLGPRINAGGRVGEPALGSTLLACDDPETARELSRRLDGYNTERREIEARVLDEALAQAESRGGMDLPALLVAGDGWHAGVIGIVASRLIERFHRPVCVAAFEGDLAKGSGRSVPGIDLGAIIIAARQKGILAGGGGHAMAAGFAVSRDRLPEFTAFLQERVAAQSVTGNDLGRTLLHDGHLSPQGAHPDMVEALKVLGPFGQGNAEPRFVLSPMIIGKADVVGGDHVRLFARATGGGGSIKGICFRAADRPLGRALLESGGRPVQLLGRLRLDDWMGRRSVQFQIDDAAGL